MSKHNKFFGFCCILLAPEEGNPSGSGSLSKDDMIDFMSKDDDKDEVIDLEDKGKGKDKDKEDTIDLEDDENKDDDEDKEEEKDELAEFDDDELPDEEELELISPARKSEILKQFPDLFKKFPYLEKAYYREQQFSEIFPTPAEAKEASEKAQALDSIEETLVKGESKELLTNLREADANGYAKFIDNLLPTLAEVDEKAYGVIVGNIIKHSVRVMVSEGKKMDSKDLEVAAQILYKFTFGNSEWEEPKALAKPDSKDPNDPQKAAEEKEKKIVQKQFERSRDSLNVRVNNSLKATIEANIDNKDQLNPYVKKNASREAFEEVTKILSTDKRLIDVLDKLWDRALKSDFDEKDLNAIRAAINARARTVLPAAIKKARLEALKGMGKSTRTKDEDDDTDNRGTKRDSPPQTHTRRQQPIGRIKEAKDIPKGMSTLDFLNSD